MTRRKKYKAADLFCGAGGMSLGAKQSGRIDVVLAVNHWRTAVLSHQANHPDTRHICARIDDVDPRNDRTLPALDILLAAPECTHHSNARGGQPYEDQKRATPWHVVIWAEAKHPKMIVVENVREFRDWGPLMQKRDNNGRALWLPDGRPWMAPDKSRKGETFKQWLKSLESVGYRVDHQLLNAADYGAATTRRRLFIVAQRSDLRRKTIPWPDPTHDESTWRPASSIIDWSRPCPSIFDRKRPLADKTLNRIEAGLKKFVGEAAEPFVVTMRQHMDGQDITRPLPTITAGAGHHALAVPFQFKAMGCSPGLTRGINCPVPTIVACRENHSIVVPFIIPNFGERGGQQLDEPLDTITTRDRFGLATASLVETMGRLGVVDVGFRMLEVEELARAQGFPENYELFGTKAERVKQVGNAVCPPVMRAICETLTA